ncbi:MAG TPA: hypothetical protein VHW23_35020 [Kofleriaceae bacterium]|jgi:hypothetical protein|nr:hypothetical protein [Kofleriaceae bacterium]
MRAWQLGLLAPLVMGCPDRSIDKIGPTQSGVVIKKIPVSADIDILFVIDNSASTADKQMLFLQNFPRFVQALDAFPMGRPNLHLGVISSTVDIGTSGFVGCPSPDPHDNGLLQSTPRMPDCTPPSGPFIVDTKNPDGSRTTNYAAGDTLEQTLSCIAQLGATGCGFEAPLEAMKRALDGSQAENTGFIRNGAYLAVIFLTDEDDASVQDNTVFTLPDDTVGGRNDFRVQPLFAYQCTPAISATKPGTYTRCTPRTNSYLRDPEYYSQFLSGIKGGGQVIVAAIAAPPPGLQTNDDPPQTASSPDIMTGLLTLNGAPPQLALLPSCTATVNGNPAIGRPAVRLASFVSDFGDRGRFYTVCQSDYSAALADIGRTIFQSITPCLDGPIDPTDAEPANPGPQLQCSVTDTRVDDQTGKSGVLIPTCQMADATTPAAGGARPCWWIRQDPVACPTTDTGFELEIERAQPPAPGTTVVVECALVDRM